MAQPDIAIGETIQRVPCLERGFATRRGNMGTLQAHCAPGEHVFVFLLSPTLGGHDMGARG